MGAQGRFFNGLVDMVLATPSQPKAVGYRNIAMWVHGHTVSLGGPPPAEAAGRELCLLQHRQGWATRFILERRDPDAKPSAWFQLAIPTPARVDGAPMALNRFTLLFRTKDESTGVAGIDLWSGPQIVDWTFLAGEAPLSGDYRKPRTENQWEPRSSDGGRRFPMEYGLGISVNVAFGGERSWIEFCGAGAEFVAQTEVTA